MTNLKLMLFVWVLVTLTPALTANNIIPFELAGKLIIVRATVNGQNGNFILDTGVPGLILNARYFEALSGKKQLLGINGYGGGIAEIFPDVEIGGFYWKRVSAQVIPMLHLENSRGIPIHGLLGSELFDGYSLVIDYQQFEIGLYPLDRKGENAEFEQFPPPVELLPFRTKGSMPLVTILMDGKKGNFIIDTGAELNLMEDRYEKKLAGHLPGMMEPSFGGLGVGPLSVMIYKMSVIQIPGLSISPMKTAFVNLAKINQWASGPEADGILGYEFLSHYRIGINFKKREIYFWHYDNGLAVDGKE